MAKNYFTESEFTRSATAKKLGIANEMTDAQRKHWEAMRDEVLNPFRKEWGAPIIISSGFRCPALNQAVGGVKNSAHLYGWGVDLVPSEGRSVEDLFTAFKWWLLKKDIRFDQLFIERNNQGTQWVHYGHRDKNGSVRGQIGRLNA